MCVLNKKHHISISYKWMLLTNNALITYRFQNYSATKLQEGYLASAKWECALGVKDTQSKKKWEEESIKSDSGLVLVYFCCCCCNL